jgi:hypothetical protein
MLKSRVELKRHICFTRYSTSPVRKIGHPQLLTVSATLNTLRAPRTLSITRQARPRRNRLEADGRHIL